MAWIRHLKYLALVRNQESRNGVPWYALLCYERDKAADVWALVTNAPMAVLLSAHGSCLSPSLVVVAYMGVDSRDGGFKCANGSLASTHANAFVYYCLHVFKGVDSCCEA